MLNYLVRPRNDMPFGENDPQTSGMGLDGWRKALDVRYERHVVVLDLGSRNMGGGMLCSSGQSWAMS